MPTFFTAVLADISRLLGAFRSRMTFLAANAAGAFEDARMRTLGLVMALLTTVEAATTIALTRLWALTSEMARLTAAVR